MSSRPESPGFIHGEVQNSQSLSDIEFSDLYLEPSGDAWYKRSPSDREHNTLSGQALRDALDLREHVQQHVTGIDFSAIWRNMRFRVGRVETFEGDVFVCRKLVTDIFPLASLGFPPLLVDSLLSADLNRGGIVLFTGQTGAGKSCSLAAWIVSRLERFGGAAWTVENPIEIIIGGRHAGENGVMGSCYQTEVRNDDDFGASIQRILRAAPNMIMIGEIRNSGAAYQAMLAGTSGHLVGASLHANDILSALERMRSMLSEARPNGNVLNFMSESLAAVIHQSLVKTFVEGREKTTLRLSQLIIAGSKNATAIRSHIREGDFSLLSSEIERQQRLSSSPVVNIKNGQPEGKNGGIADLLRKI